jgi:hypothetical protein
VPSKDVIEEEPPRGKIKRKPKSRKTKEVQDEV